MTNTGHKLSSAPMKAAVERTERVKAALGDGRTICGYCEATLATYEQKCNAPLDFRCEGFERVCAAEEGRTPKL